MDRLIKNRTWHFPVSGHIEALNQEMVSPRQREGYCRLLINSYAESEKIGFARSSIPSMI